MSYFPTPNALLDRLATAGLDDSSGNSVGLHMVQQIVSYMITEVGIDDARYFQDYPDIGRAYETGEIISGTQHYAQYGYFERRRALPANFDPDWYLRTYPDVQLFIAEVHDLSAADHFLERGHAEWRLPCEKAKPALNLWLDLLT